MQSTKDTALTLLQIALRNRGELQLDDSQIENLNRLYWSGLESGHVSIGAVSEKLTAGQLDQVTRLHIAEGPASPAEPQALAAIVDKAIGDRFKDVPTVQADIAAAVAGKLMDWSKLFATAVGIPLALILIILGFFGIANFNDVQTAAQRIDAKLSRAQENLTKTVDSGNQKINGAVRDATDAQSKLTGELQRAQAEVQRFASLDERLKALSASSERTAQAINARLAGLARTDGNLSNQLNTLQNKVQSLGDLSAQHETGGADAGYIRKFSNGPEAYGPWGLEKFYVAAMIAEPGFPFKKEFSNLSPETPQFDAAWSALGKKAPIPFRAAQFDFLNRRLYKPIATTIESKDGVDIRTRTITLQNVIWSIADEAGYGAIYRAVADLQSKGQWNAASPQFDELLIRALFAQVAKSTNALPPPLRDKIAKKNLAEMNGALKDLKEEQRPGR